MYYEKYKALPLPKWIALKMAKIKTAYELSGITKIASKTLEVIQKYLKMKYVSFFSLLLNFRLAYSFVDK